ncbi:MAG: ABC transporter permease, partial [Eubacteriales bacterium]
LVVSSIMIGIITYISVLERIKEIGILRAIGASKRDISHVFQAETLIVGFTAGVIGILFTLVLCIPVNVLIRALSGFREIGASLPPLGAIILILISMGLTLIAGLIPARIAAKKEPVEALRSE